MRGPRIDFYNDMESEAAVIISWDMIESIPGLKGTAAAMDAAMKVTEARERMAQGIEAQVAWTPEFLDQSPIGRRTS